MTTKLKIDLLQGILEVEGTETFVKAIYNDFKIHFIGEDAGEAMVPAKRKRQIARKVSPPARVATAAPPPKKTAPSVETAPATPAAKSKPADGQKFYQTLADLDLSAQGDRVSLVEFMDSKFPITNEERNLVFLYYLQYLLKSKPNTADHIFTCYKAAKIRVPLNLENSLTSTVTQRRWIKMTKTGRLSVTPAGKLYVEKQLPKKLKN